MHLLWNLPRHSAVAPERGGPPAPREQAVSGGKALLDWIEWGLGLVAFFSGGTVFGLAILNLRKPELAFWPAQEKESWQDWTFRILFRVFWISLFVLSAVIVLPDPDPLLAWNYLVGVPLALIGLAGALGATLDLGWRGAFGEREGLKAEGWFRFSRNPAYVATWIGLAGWALIVSDPRVTFLCALWAALYFIMVPLEERWMYKVYGAAYREYCRRVPRFL